MKVVNTDLFTCVLYDEDTWRNCELVHSDIKYRLWMVLDYLPFPINNDFILADRQSKHNNMP